MAEEEKDGDKGGISAPAQEDRMSRLGAAARRGLVSILRSVLLLPLMPLARVIGGRLPFENMRTNVGCAACIRVTIILVILVALGTELLGG